MANTKVHHVNHFTSDDREPIVILLERLETEVLDPTFEKYGNFIDHDPRNERGELVVDPGQVQFWGNFYTVSGVFKIDTDDAELIEKLTAAIRANQTTPAYLEAKFALEERKKRALEREAEAHRTKNAEEIARARMTLAMHGENRK